MKRTHLKSMNDGLATGESAMNVEETAKAPRKRKPKKQLTVQLKDHVGTERAKVMDCLEWDGLGKEAAVWQLVLAWYLPFTLDEGDSNLRSAAIQSVGVLEGRIAAILRYANLLPPTATVLSQPTSTALAENGSPSNALSDGARQSRAFSDRAEESPEADEDWEWQQRKQERQALDRALLGI
jgi:hypothetical protein